MSDQRTAQLAANLETLEKRLTAACTSAGRRLEELTLIAVTKTFPLDDVAALADLGVREFGENRDAEAKAKAAGRPDLHWHFVGRLQRNKCRSVASYASVVHSVDRVEVAQALQQGAEHAGRLIDVMVQVSLDGDSARGGAQPADVAAVAEACAAASRLRLSGVMALAPLDVSPDPAFARLAEIAAGVRANHPEAASISAGMSGDLEAAIRNGATHLRVGTALLGHRTPKPG